MSHEIYLYGKEKSDEMKSSKLDKNTYYWFGIAVLLFLIGLWYIGLILLVLILVFTNIKPKEPKVKDKDISF